MARSRAGKSIPRFERPVERFFNFFALSSMSNEKSRLMGRGCLAGTFSPMGEGKIVSIF